MLKINLVYANICVMLMSQDIYPLSGFLNSFDKMFVVSKLIIEIKTVTSSFTVITLEQQHKIYS